MNTSLPDTSDGTEAKPDAVPRPTCWPAVLAFGVTFLFWGIVTSWTISLVGLVVLIVSLVGWIKEIIHEHS